MVEVEYVGPLGAVRVPEIAGEVVAGTPVKVSADVAARLLAQSDIWREVAAKAAKSEKAAV